MTRHTYTSPCYLATAYDGATDRSRWRALCLQVDVEVTPPATRSKDVTVLLDTQHIYVAWGDTPTAATETVLAQLPAGHPLAQDVETLVAATLVEWLGFP